MSLGSSQMTRLMDALPAGNSPAKGHYIAKVKQRLGEWLQFDDTQVVEVPPRSVFDGQAYVLLYQKVDAQ
jgi:ubiquitin C-terminal hydrolase